NDEGFNKMFEIKIPSQRVIQDYKSTYNDIREWIIRGKNSKNKDELTIDWNDIVFEIDLLKSQEINLDYILELIFEHNKKVKDKAERDEEGRRVIRVSLGNRAKESLDVDFINQTNLDDILDKASVLDEFYQFAQAQQQKEVIELIRDENLNEDATKRYIKISLKREYVSKNGTDLKAVLPKMGPLSSEYLMKKD